MNNSRNLILLGGNLRSVRKALKLTQSNFAKKMGVSGGFISEVELGKSGVSPSFLKLLEIEYGVNTEWLETGIGEMFSPVQKAHSNESIEKVITLFAAQNSPEIGDLTDQEKRIIRMFRKLDPERKQRIIDIVTDAFIALRE